MAKYNGLHKLEDLIFFINKPIIGKKGVHYQKLLKDWRLIIGEKLSKRIIPTKISSIRHRQNSVENILHIAVNNAAVAAEMIYQVDIIKEQVNMYFGYEYIQKIKFNQAVFKVTPSTENIVHKITPQQTTKIESLTSQYEQNDEIKDILVSLAANIIQSHK